MNHPAHRRFATLLLITALVVLPAAGAFAANAGPPRVSPPASVTQTVGLSDITIAYSRPSVNGRTVFGELEEFGKVWRTGANEATAFTISHDAKIDGKALAAGTYALFTIPGESEWTIIFNSVAEQWGAFGRDEEQDELTIKTMVKKAPHQEQFLIDVPSFTADTGTVSIRWAETQVTFDVTFDVHAAALAKAKAEVAAGDNPRAGFNWARYFQTEGIHLDTALEWADQAAANSDIYWTHALKARLLAAHGKKDEAKAAAEHAFTKVESDQNAQAAASDADKLREEVKDR